MATITDYFQQAQLSLAAYALGLQSGMSGQGYEGYVAALVDKGMSRKQAQEFADTYAVVDQVEDPSGFSGTLFRHLDGTLHFAIRGSGGIKGSELLKTNTLFRRCA